MLFGGDLIAALPQLNQAIAVFLRKKIRKKWDGKRRGKGWKGKSGDP